MTTYHLLLAVHLVLAVFAVGPLVHAATTAGRGVRLGDGAATASASRVLRIYSYASVLVIAAGFALMNTHPYPSFASAGSDGIFYGGRGGNPRLADFGDTYIWLSLVLWVLAMAAVLGVIVPTLDKATKQIEAQQSVVTLTGRVAASGGVVGLLFVAIVVLMAFRPGQ